MQVQQDSSLDMYKCISVKVENEICVITLNQPDVRNALSLEMRGELTGFLNKAKNLENIKVIILTGSGTAFSAGGDLTTLKTVDAIAGRKRLQAGHEVIRSILNLEKPVIAALNGVAAGAGVSLALACDVIVASEKSSFIQSFMKVGLVPDLGACYFLPKLIGRHRALELLLTGGKLSAHQAHSLGIINRIVPEDWLMKEAYSIATMFAEGPGLAMGFAKRITNRKVVAEIEETLELEAFAQALCFESQDFKEGINAFFEKRKPQFE